MSKEIKNNHIDIIDKGNEDGKESEEIENPVNKIIRKEPITDFISAPIKSIHEELFERVFQLIYDKGLFFSDTYEKKLKPPTKFVQPEILSSVFDFKLGETGTDMDTLLDCFKQVIKLSPHNSHPYKINGHGSGLNPYGIAADFLATTMTSVVITYLYAPVFTLMEHTIFNKLIELVGYKTDRLGDGVGVPDTNISDSMAIGAALRDKYPLIRHHGYFRTPYKQPMIFFASHSKYRLMKIANFMRFESDCCVIIDTDVNGRMDIIDLKNKIIKSIQNQQNPFIVIGVAGTSTTGAIDPLNEIGDICLQYKLWFHVSAEIGGVCILSDKQRHRVLGIEKSDSITWSAQFILTAPCCTCILICRKPNMLKNAFALDSPIVFHETDLYDIKWNTGDRTIQTSRRPDILKIWFMWKALGQIGLSKQIDSSYKNTEFFKNEIIKNRTNDGFKLVHDNMDTPHVAFYYIPIHLRKNILTKTDLIKYSIEITNTTEKIKKHLLINGIMHIASRNGQPNYPRHIMISLNNTVLTKKDIIYILDQINFIGLGIPSSSSSSYKNIDEDIVIKESILNNNPPKPPPPPSTFPSFISSPITKLHGKFFQNFFILLKKYGLYFQKEDSNVPSLEFHEPEELLKLINFKLEMNGLSDDELLDLAGQIIKYSIHMSHIHYLYQLKGGLDPYSIAGDFIQITMTSGSVTYEDAPVYTLMENEIIKIIRDRLGYPENGLDSDGLIVPGGSLCNIYSQRVALYNAQQQQQQQRQQQINKNNKIDEKRYVLYISNAGHYSPEKASILFGIGENNCILIKTNIYDQMIPAELIKSIEATLKSGGTPFMVVASMGTTVGGAIDPINDIADICEKYNIWLHIDGSFGGCLIFSNREMTNRPGLKESIKRSNSFSLNAHKMLCVPVTCSVLLFKEDNINLKKIFEGYIDDDDVEQGTTLYNQNIWDNSKKHFQKERRPEIFKFWSTWKAKGMNGFEKHINKTIDNTKFAVDEINRRKDRFHLVIPKPELSVICFSYVPPIINQLDWTSDEFKKRASKVGPILQDRMVRGDYLTFVVEEDYDQHFFIKFNLFNSALNPQSIIEIFDLMEEIGHDIIV